ncbi:MAG: hydrogenase formation protein HypD [Anaerolineae bacterium]
MKYLDAFRDPALARRLVERVAAASRTPVTLMEFCGGHTHAIFQTGLRQILPPTVRLRSGPGCPVCVTSTADIDHAIALAAIPGVTLATFGDMIRVPGSTRSLDAARAAGADVRIVYSPLDALDLARRLPDRQVILLGVGFETTAPGVAATILQAEAQGVPNLTALSLHKLTLPVTRAILDAGEVGVQGIIGPGHVATVTGAEAWRMLPRDYGVPCAISGFEPLDLLEAIAHLVEMVEAGRPDLYNGYARSVRPEGNRVAQETLKRAFQVVTADWRGIGLVPASGLALREELAHRDAARVFPVEVPPPVEPRGCRCGEVVRGVLEPPECALFGRVCTPEKPVGPCMVSAEGACAAHYHYGVTE